jgi:hypothetical protein
MSSPQVQPGWSLPETMPESWLNQIKKAVKAEAPKVWVVLFGSSLLAALVGSGFSYRITEKNISATKELEATKTRLALRKELVQTRVAAYGKLATALRTLEARLSTVDALIQLTKNYRHTEATTSQIRGTIKSVGLAERDVIAAKDDVTLSGTDMAGKVDTYLQELTPLLGEASLDPQRFFPDLEARRSELLHLMSLIQEKTSAEIETIQ